MVDVCDEMGLMLIGESRQGKEKQQKNKFHIKIHP